MIEEREKETTDTEYLEYTSLVSIRIRMPVDRAADMAIPNRLFAAVAEPVRQLKENHPEIVEATWQPMIIGGEEVDL
jgi:hypothetical protein